MTPRVVCLWCKERRPPPHDCPYRSKNSRVRRAEQIREVVFEIIRVGRQAPYGLMWRLEEMFPDAPIQQPEVRYALRVLVQAGKIEYRRADKTYQATDRL